MKQEKFRMFEALGDTISTLKENMSRYALNTLITVVITVFASFLLVAMMSNISHASYVYNSGFSPRIIVGLAGYLLFIVLIEVLQIIYIKITDDLYEKRTLDYGEQFKFVFKRIVHIFLAYLMLAVPGFTMVYLIDSLTSVNQLTGLFVSVVYSLVALMFMMVNPAIVIEEMNAFKAIRRSLTMMWKNILRCIGFFIVMFLILMVIMLLVSFIAMIFIRISPAFSFVLMCIYIPIVFLLAPIPMIFKTILYKQVDHKPYDQDESIEALEDDYFEEIYE